MSPNNPLEIGYTFPTWLVNTLIGAILTALLGIGAYMLRWNIADVEWKAAIAERLGSLKLTMDKLEQRVEGSGLSAVNTRLEQVERRLGRIEEAVWEERKNDRK